LPRERDLAVRASEIGDRVDAVFGPEDEGVAVAAGNMLLLNGVLASQPAGSPFMHARSRANITPSVRPEQDIDRRGQLASFNRDEHVCRPPDCADSLSWSIRPTATGGCIVVGPTRAALTVDSDRAVALRQAIHAFTGGGASCTNRRPAARRARPVAGRVAVPGAFLNVGAMGAPGRLTITVDRRKVTAIHGLRAGRHQGCRKIFLFLTQGPDNLGVTNRVGPVRARADVWPPVQAIGAHRWRPSEGFEPMAVLFDALKRAAKAGWSYQYNRSNARWVANILKEHAAAGMPLAPETKRLCDTYARDVLGGVRYAPWLYLYAHVSGQFREGWIPDNFYGERVVGHTSGSYGETCDSRALNTRLFDAEEFPDVGAHVNGLFTDRAGNVVGDDRLADTLFRDSDRVVFKLDQSMQGLGIHFYDRDRLDPDEIRRLGNGVFQSFIEQHPFFDSFGGAAVATIRLTTAIDDAGAVTLRAGYLRLGRARDTHVQSASHLRVPIDLESGALGDKAYLPNWMTTGTHPDSGADFKAKVIPNFEECARVVTSNHRKLPFVRCLGWDVSVDRARRVRIIEWNGGHNDIKFGEATQGPCFRDLNWERFRPN